MTEDYEKLPLLLDMLKEFKVKATFGIIGKWLEAEPEIHKRMVAEGHEIMNHTYSHPNNEVFHPNEYFNQLTPEQQAKQITDCHETIKKILGVTPVGFRTPHFGDLHTPFVYAVLEKLGYQYSSSIIMTKTKSKGRPYYPSKKDYLLPGKEDNASKVLEIPVISCPEHYVPAIDSVHCIRQAEPAHPGKEFVKIVSRTINMSAKQGIPAIFDFGPQDVGSLKEFQEILEQTVLDERTRVMNCGALAAFISKTSYNE